MQSSGMKQISGQYATLHYFVLDGLGLGPCSRIHSNSEAGMKMPLGPWMWRTRSSLIQRRTVSVLTPNLAASSSGLKNCLLGSSVMRSIQCVFWGVSPLIAPWIWASHLIWHARFLWVSRLVARSPYMGFSSLLARSCRLGFSSALARSPILGFSQPLARSQVLGFSELLARSPALGFSAGVTRSEGLGFSRLVARSLLLGFSVELARSLDCFSLQQECLQRLLQLQQHFEIFLGHFDVAALEPADELTGLRHYRDSSI